MTRTTITADIPADMAARLDLVIATTLRNYPATTAQDVISTVLCAGIETVEGNAAIGTACAQRDSFRRALVRIAGLPEEAPAREAVCIARAMVPGWAP